MAEIKSTLDLVMEKTRDMVQSPEEKERRRREELENKARSLVLKIQDGRLKPQDLPRSLDDPGREEEQTRVLVQILAGNLALDGENEILLEAIRLISGPSHADDLRGLEDLFQAYASSLADLETAVRKTVRMELKDKGISGSAIEPNIKKDARWIEGLTGLRNRYEAKLDAARTSFE